MLTWFSVDSNRVIIGFHVSLFSGVVSQEFEVKEVKNLLNTCTRDQMLVQKKITIREGQIEQQRHERHQILKACKVCTYICTYVQHMTCATCNMHYMYYVRMYM